MKIITMLLLLSVYTIADDSIIKEFDNDLGQGNDFFSTQEDSMRFSASIGTSYQFKLSEQQEFDFQFLKRLKGSNDGWLALQLKSLNATYDQIADPVKTENMTPHLNSDVNQDRDGQIQSVSMIGIGYSYRFKFLQAWLESNQVFETTSFYFNYVTSNDETTDLKYSGYGLTADFGIHKRSFKSFFYGLKISYNLASVTREAITDEPEEERSLRYGWFTTSFEMGYFF